jgi:hypothetical protein
LTCVTTCSRVVVWSPWVTVTVVLCERRFPFPCGTTAAAGKHTPGTPRVRNRPGALTPPHISTVQVRCMLWCGARVMACGVEQRECNPTVNHRFRHFPFDRHQHTRNASPHTPDTTLRVQHVTKVCMRRAQGCTNGSSMRCGDGSFFCGSLNIGAPLLIIIRNHLSSIDISRSSCTLFVCLNVCYVSHLYEAVLFDSV